MIGQIESSEASDLRSEMKNYVYWIDHSVRDPARVDSQLLAIFVDEFSRLAANLGEPGGVGVDTALDQAIGAAGGGTESTSRLYIAKARYYRTLINENDKRLAAIISAVSNSTLGSEEWAEAMLELSGYYSDTSRYREALEVVSDLRRKLNPDLLSLKYECGAKVREAAALFGTFRELSRIERNMHQAIDKYRQRVDEDEDLVRWVAMAYYYLGRVAEAQRRYTDSLESYIRGLKIRERGPDDYRVMGFFHLRIAELLTVTGNLSGARDHLNYASHLYRTCSNQSSGWLQTCLGYASLAAIEGKYDAAIGTASETRKMARKLGYWRGELLSLSYLLALYIARRNFRQIASTIHAIVLTARNGELGRNSIIRLFVRMPSISLDRISRQRTGRRAIRDALVCSCRLHSDISTVER